MNVIEANTVIGICCSVLGLGLSAGGFLLVQSTWKTLRTWKRVSGTVVGYQSNFRKGPPQAEPRSMRRTQMKTLITITLLSAFSIAALARVIVPWTKERMEKASDLVVVGNVTRVRDLDETNITLWPGCKFIGVEATFAVSKVFKGDTTNRCVILHYYRFDRVIPPNAPCFLNLRSTDTNRFLLYLVRDGVGRYSPVSGQIDPSVDAVRVFPAK